MKINRSNKAKIIIFASLGIAVVLVIMLFVIASSKSESEKEISVRIQDEKDLTVNDILAQSENKPRTYESSVLAEAQSALEDSFPQEEKNQEVIRLQEHLREIESNSYSNSYSYSPPPSFSKKGKREEEQVEVIHEKVVEKPELDEEDNVEEEKKKPSRFFSVSSQKKSNTIQAKVYGDQKVQSGGMLKLVLAQSIVLENGKVIPKGVPVYGQVEIQNNRLQIHISSIRVNNNIFPFHKEVYDQDGMPGIYIPNNTMAELASEASSTAVSNTNVGSTGSEVIDGTVRVIESVARGAMHRKTSRLTVTIKSNYKVLLQ